MNGRTLGRYKQNLHIDGNKVISYTTHVATIDSTNRELLVHGWWSVTTSKHINYVADLWNLTIKKDAPKTEQHQQEEKELEGSMLRSCAMVAAFGSILCPKPEESTAWKKRFLSLVPGIDIPEDFDQLPAEEKQKRLDGAISIGLGR